MSSRIANRSSALCMVPLNSGATIVLAPGETSGPVSEMDIAGNDRIAKLAGRGDIAVARSEEPAADGKPKKSRK